MKRLSKGIALIFILFMFSQSIFGAERWQGAIPEDGDDPESWRKLLSELVDKELYYSALVAANRMLIFFNDLKTKEAAYKAIIHVSDQGYPFPTRSLYITGDIEPRVGYHFVNSYNLFKGIVNKEKGLDKWAEHYFQKVDIDKYPKYLFYKAIRLYSAREYHKSIFMLRKILDMNHSAEHIAFVKKVSRTLARIYFELEEYEKALDIYMNFLLRTNPVKPTDWLETVWSFYHMRKFNRALGMLYNLESETPQNSLPFV